ncbi:isoaspartyl peptidase/L-asparaginase family protein [Pedobacter cryoconitis]|uniref:isoaspartyl peptidase/L-asparaginase family protein n=1 Tax=Pedobacter cryoconitis TaxID=188932 RepID=UPI00178F4D02|nr:isoaspartyl peptidase/L-asparaginase [Pedobacter cryoconitis]MBB5646487.1 beta-aspartyl-peptidase (threonine type) [Pedobacter cryoconitis]
MMNKNLKIIAVLLCCLVANLAYGQEKYVMVIHGGAGTITRKNMSPEKEAAYVAALTKALQTGYDVLKSGKTSLDAVEATIHIMEDSPLFNAGKGAVFTHDGKNEMDAAIMDGKTMMAGAVAGVTTIKNPISAARAVMEKSEHVMMVGHGAELFAKQAGIEIVDPKYFYTKERWDGLQQAIKEDSTKSVLDHGNKKSMKLGTINHDYKFGTVGAVALDKNGNLAAGTSTGGMTNKRYGRIGDSPIIGAGTYANNATAGISCTGWGEFYIRNVVAHDISAMMEYKNMSVADASRAALDKVGKMGGDGGLIALDAKGNVSMPFNTEGMYRGTVTENGKIEVLIYK